MASAVLTSDHHHFYCYSTLLMDIGGGALRLVVDKFCGANDLTFHDFLSKYKEDLFHGRKNSPKVCCMCSHPSSLSCSGVFTDDQWEQLYVLHTYPYNDEVKDHFGHQPNECPQKWTVNPSVKLEQLEINFVADILYNTRPVLLHYLHDHMHHYGQSRFKSFLQHYRHLLFHHYRKENCCLCLSKIRNHISKKIHFNDKQWKGLFRSIKKCSKCLSPSADCSSNYMSRPVSSEEIYLSVLVKVLNITVPIFQHINSVIEKRHVVYAHPRNNTRMDSQSFEDEWQCLTDCILKIVEKTDGTNVMDDWKNSIDLLKSTIPHDEESDELLLRIEKMEYQEDMKYQGIQKVQRQILNEVTRERKDNVDLTRGRIYEHMKGLRVMCNSVEKGLTILQQRNVLIFTGITGQGKTWHCLEILAKMTNKCIVQLDSSNLDLREWDRLIGTEENIVIWIDNLRASAIRDQKTFFERLHVQLSKCKGRMKFLSSILSSEFDNLTDAKPPILADHCIINLNDEEWQNRYQKQKMLTDFLKRGPLEHSEENEYLSISIVSDVDNENLNGEPYNICENTIRKISKLSPSIGFPECCRRFCSDPKLFAMGEIFFTKPTQSTLDLVSALANSSERDQRISFIVLCLLCLHPRHIDLNHLQSNIEIPVCLQECLNVTITPNTIFGRKIIKNIVPIFAGITNHTEIQFQHETIKVAVAITFCELDHLCQEYFIENCPLDLVLYSCHNMDNKLFNDLAPCVQEDVIHKRLIHEMIFKPYRHSLKQILWYFGLYNFQNWKRFAEKFNRLDNWNREIVELEIARNTYNMGYKKKETISNKTRWQGQQQDAHTHTDVNNDHNKFYEIERKEENKPTPSYKNEIERRKYIGNLNLGLDLFFSFLKKDPDKFASYVVNDGDKVTEVDYFSVLAFINVTSLHSFLLFSSQYLSVSSLRNQSLNLTRAEKLLKPLNSIHLSERIGLCLELVMMAAADAGNAFRFRRFLFDFAKLNSAVLGDLRKLPSHVASFLTILSQKSVDQKILGEDVYLAIDDKNVDFCRHLESLIRSESTYRRTLLDTVSLCNEKSYSFSHIQSMQIQDEDFITAVMIFDCNDLELCSIVRPSVVVFKPLIARFINEFSLFHICTPSEMFELESCQKCSVQHHRDQKVSEMFNERLNTSFDTCLFVAQKIAEDTKAISVYTLCNTHLYDFIKFNKYVDSSFNFKSAVEKIDRERMKTLKNLINEVSWNQEDIADLFSDACDKNSYLIVRLFLEEEYEIENNVLLNGFLHACVNGHTLVVDTLLSWRDGIITEDILCDALRTTTIHNCAQTSACILMSCQVISYLRRETVDEADVLYKTLVYATHACAEKYTQNVLTFYRKRSLKVGEHLLQSKISEVKHCTTRDESDRVRDYSNIKWNIPIDSLNN